MIDEVDGWAWVSDAKRVAMACYNPKCPNYGKRYLVDVETGKVIE